MLHIDVARPNFVQQGGHPSLESFAWERGDPIGTGAQTVVVVATAQLGSSGQSTHIADSVDSRLGRIRRPFRECTATDL